MIAIYAVQNKLNGKAYIGQTANPNQRFKAHLGGWKSSSFLLKRAIKKYGASNFECTVLESWPTQHEADDAERFWITTLQTLGDGGYNLYPGGWGGNKGMKMPDGFGGKISLALKGKVRTKEHAQKIVESRRRNGHVVSPDLTQKAKERNQKTWEVTFPDGHKEVVVNLRGFCRNNNLSKSNMFAVSRGQVRHHKGFKVKLFGTPDPVFVPKKNQWRVGLWHIVYDDGKTEEIKNLHQFSKSRGINVYQLDGKTYRGNGFTATKIGLANPKVIT